MKINFRDIFKEKRFLLRLASFLTADAILIFLSVILAFLVRFEGKIPGRYFLNIEGIIFLALIITIPIFYFFKLYHFSWVYVSTAELISLAKATGLSFLILTASFFVLRDHSIFTGFPRSTLFITFFFIFILCGGVRISKRIYLQMFPLGKKEEKEKTLIVGAGNTGEQILRNILMSKDVAYLPVGFIDDDPTKKGTLIHGINVLGKIGDIPEIVKGLSLKDGVMIIAMPSAGAERIREAVKNGREAGLTKIKIVPPINEIINGKISIGSLREVGMGDLLGREQVSLDKNSIENFLQNKNILITGASGSIGSELCRQVAKFKPSSLLLLDQDETGIFNISEELKDNFSHLGINSLVADITDETRVDKIFKDFKPQVVFHAAAYKHVPLMEENADEAVKNNIFGTKTLVETAIKRGTDKFVFISTDKAINPTSVMGATKRVGEMICQASTNGTKFVSVRFGNVLDSRGSVIPIFREKIKKREPIEITHPDMKRYFMTCPEACLLVMQAGAMGEGGEVFVLDMGKPIKILDLAREMIKLSGLEPDKDIPIVFTKPRPGEKLFEEILTAEEGVLATKNQKIFITKLSDIDKEKLEFKIKELEEKIGFGDKKVIINILKELIPSYNQNNY